MATEPGKRAYEEFCIQFDQHGARWEDLHETARYGWRQVALKGRPQEGDEIYEEL